MLMTRKQINGFLSQGTWIAALALMQGAWLSEAPAYEGLVQKQVFSMPSYTTVSGKAIKDVRVGYEAYGKLNETRDNVILITHFFLSNSHAAGKYRTTDAAPGYWDAIIGSGKPVDTDKYFVISSDTLVNVNGNHADTVTTGPASINPDTGKPYGMDFPLVTIRDWVNVQKALLDSLGISKLHAVMGPSSGSVQAFTWAVAYPDQVERVIGVIPGDVECNPYAISVLNLWTSPIRMDTNWNKGDYYNNEKKPLEGLKLAIKNVVVNTYHPIWMEKQFERKVAKPGQDPQTGLDNLYLAESWLDGLADAFVGRYDANNFLYHAKAVQNWSVKAELDAIKAKILLIPSKGDLLALPEYSKNAIKALRAHGKQVEVFELDEGMGHFDGIGAIPKAGETIRKFLTSPVAKRQSQENRGTANIPRGKRR